MKLQTIFSYLFGVIGAYLLAPQIMPQRFLEGVEARTKESEARLFAAANSSYEKIQAIFKNKKLESVADTSGCLGVIIGIWIMVAIFEVLSKKYPILNQHKETIALCWFWAMVVTNAFAQTESEKKFVKILSIILTPVFIIGTLPLIFSILLMYALPVILIILAVVPFLALHWITYSQLWIARKAAYMKAEKFLGYIGFSFIMSAAFLGIWSALG